MAFLVLAATVTIVAITTKVILELRNNGVDTKELSLAVVDFANLINSRDGASTAALSGLLQVGLVEASPIRVISPDYLHDLRRRLFRSAHGAIEEDQVLEVAEKAGATVLLAGQFGSLNGKQYVTWRLVDTRNGKSIGAGRLNGADVAVLADEVVSAVVPALVKYYRLGSLGEVLSVTALTTNSGPAYEHYAQGMLAKSEGKDEAAVREFVAAVKIDSTFALAYFELSRLHDGNKPLRDSYAEQAWHLRARLSAKDRMRLEGWRSRLSLNLVEAVSTYEELLNRWPDDHEALVELAREYHRQVYSYDASRIAEMGLKLYPDDLDLGLVYGRALRCIGRFGDALEFSRGYAMRHPYTPNAWNELGWCLVSLGFPDSAEVYFSKALSIDSTHADSRMSLCYLEYYRGDVEEAIQRCQRLISRDEDLESPVICDWQGSPGIALMLAEVGRVRSALDILEAECRKQNLNSGSSVTVEIARARVWLRSGKGSEALRWARQFSFGLTAQFEIAWAFLAQDSTDAARRA